MATLCEDCANINAGKDGERCCWAGRSIPVEGWTAVEVRNKDTGAFYTYQVIDCPNFRKGIFRPVLDYEGCISLFEAVLEDIREDYPKENEASRRADREFIRAFVSNSEGAIDHLKLLAKKHKESQEMQERKIKRVP